MIRKAELHVHLEGTTRPTLAKELAARHNINLPDTLFNPNGTYNWQDKDFIDFLNTYDIVSSIVRTAQDYYDITYDYLSYRAAEETIYVEMIASPDHAAHNQLPYADMLAGMAAAIDDAEAKHGIVGRIIINCVRHFGVASCEKVAKLITQQPHPYVVGFGMSGNEVDFPPHLYQNTFAIAHEAGLGCTAHSGEHMGPDGIREAVAVLPISRLGHGIRATEDPELLQELIARGIAFEVCPSSNIAIGIYPNIVAHPVKQLLELGASISLNSDDPPFFNTSLANEYDIVQSAFNLNNADMERITRRAIMASFADKNTKAQLLMQLDRTPVTL